MPERIIMHLARLEGTVPDAVIVSGIRKAFTDPNSVSYGWGDGKGNFFSIATIKEDDDEYPMGFRVGGLGLTVLIATT